MTLYDELVKLFREHRLKVAPAKCECGTQFDRKFTFAELLAMHREHLAALACERAHNDFESDNCNCSYCKVIAALAKTWPAGKTIFEHFKEAVDEALR